MIRIYVGNISYQESAANLEAFFGQFGDVRQVTIVTDRDTGRARGFAFVEFANDAAASRAINEANGAELSGRTLVVSAARPRPDRGGDRGGQYR